MSSLLRLSTALRGSGLRRLASTRPLLSASLPRPALTPTITLASAKRSYHYDKDDVYGYRLPREYSMPDYTPTEQTNRSSHANLLRLVMAYRHHGHRVAELDPLSLQKRERVAALDPTRYGLNPSSSTTYPLEGIIHVGKSSDPSLSRTKAKLSTIIDHLEKVYCGRIAFEFAHIPNVSERRWFAHRIESFDRKTFSREEKLHFYSLLTRSEVFDHFMAKRFPQLKRYGLEGEESMMVALDTLFREASGAGIVDLVLCMPHRGRLNLLTDLLKFDPARLFHKVKGNVEFPEDLPATGDVLSHLATSVDLDYGNQPNAEEKLHVSLIHNPSHLEAANPVAMGKARAKQMYLYSDTNAGTKDDCSLGDRVMCVQMHGDAAFTGQGIVMECFGLSNLPHFTSGGSVHVIVNNQIGYTTPALNARSSVYTSDVGKMINAPVIHVNADYPEDVAYAVSIAFEYRNKFRKDVILDLVGYRRLGHNELDEPAFTQPQMYKTIRSRKSVPTLYQEQLQNEGVLSNSGEEIASFRDKYIAELDAHLERSYNYKPFADMLEGKWKNMVMSKTAVTKLDTGVDEDTLRFVGNASVTVPTDFTVHERLMKHHIQSRMQRVGEGNGIDWATGEALAWGTLLLEGHHVRVCGQDVGRGTFSQRHCMFVDQETEDVYIPLNNMIAADTKAGDFLKSGRQGMLEIANSSLSELAVLGFEFGMSWETPNRLNIWEAQFGDFNQCAQTIIDTFIATSEAKWLRQSSLVMLLPHGYDGAGPEHSSSRIERFLQLCDDKFDPLDDSIPVNPNMHVVNATTPAQYFHVLRRQLKRDYRKPLIIASPKGLLKSAAATSSMNDFLPGSSFQPVLTDSSIADPTAVERVLIVSGKLYYDLVKERSDRKLDQKVAILRLEELCPFPAEDFIQQVYQFSHATEWVWVQEEPQNQGAWTFIQPRMQRCLGEGRVFRYHGRPSSPVTATGVGKWHKLEQAKVISGGFEGL